MILAPTHDQAGILWHQTRRMAEESPLGSLITSAVESPFPELRWLTTAANGEETESIVMARSSSHDGRYVRGHGIDRLVVDEAAFVPDPVLSQSVPPMLAASQYREQVLLSTPFGMSGVFFETFTRGINGDPETQAFQFPSSANPRVSPDFLALQRDLMTDLAFRTEYQAEFMADQASVFRPEFIKAAIDDDVLPGPRNGHRYTIGYDPARWHDRSGCVVLDITTLPYVAIEVRDLGGREYLTQADAIKELARTYNRATVLLDATSHDQMLEELRRLGVNAQGYKFTNESKRDLIDGLVLALERGKLRLPRHDALIRELTYYRFETTAAGNVKLGAPAGAGHFDDLVTALSLALWQGKKRQVVGTIRGIPKPPSPLRQTYDYSRSALWDSDIGNYRPLR
jgi:hypothetical protein